MHLDAQDYEVYYERRALDGAVEKRGDFYEVEDMNGTLELLFGIPSGKSLEQPTLELLTKIHAQINRPHPRSSIASVSNLPGIARLVFLKGEQIVKFVCEGVVPIGATAEDNVFESGLDVHVCTALSFGRAVTAGGKTRGVFFTSEDNPVKEIFEMEDGEIVISEYYRQTQEHFDKYCIKAVVEKCPGSAEALVAIGRYKYGVTLTETGTSLRVNGLKEIGTLFESRTVLIANKKLYEENQKVRMCADNLARCFNSVLDARHKVYLVMNVPQSSVSAIMQLLPALESPTVQPLADRNFVSLASVVPKDKLNLLKLQLWQLGARGFVELDASSIL